MDFNLGLNAFGWGVLSAISLPIGALLGMWLKPKQKINSACMAFGAGALLFALTIELFGHVPHHVDAHGMPVMWVAVFGAISGGLLFDGLNNLLNNKGAFIRKLSSAKRYVSKLKIRRAKKLVAELSKVKVLKKVPPQAMALLILKVKQQSFKAGELIFNQDADADEMFFIIGGQVRIIRSENGASKQLAVLDHGETFGEMGIISGQPRTATAEAVSDVRVYKLLKRDLEDVLLEYPELKQELKDLADKRVDDLSLKSEEYNRSDWEKSTLSFLDKSTMSISNDDIQRESMHEHKGGGAAMAIWLGILIDGIPESLVIGMLAASAGGMSLAFVAGVFLANLPEAMSSAVTMRNNGMALSKIYLMWGSITLFTGIGAFIGTIIFPPDPQGLLFYAVVCIEALAAGAMLTMIAETMLPEAFEQGGSIVGLSTLGGFLSALLVKVM